MAANPKAADTIDDTSAPLIEHLAELRNRIIKSLIAFIVAMTLCFTVWNPIFNFLTRPLCDALESQGQECNLILIQLQEGFFVAVNIAMLGGFVLAFPVIAYQMWRFVAPGLYRSEKSAFLPFLVASPVMFFLGAAFAYYVIMPMGYTFFLGFQQIGMDGSAAAPGADVAAQPEGAIESLQHAGIAFQGSVNEYLSLATKFIIAFGLCCLVLGRILFEHRLVGRWLAVGMVATGVVYLLGSFAALFAPGLSAAIDPLYLIAIVVEPAFAIRLIVRGLAPAPTPVPPVAVAA